MVDKDYLDHQSPKPAVKAGPPQVTVASLETVVDEQKRRIAELEAEIEHLIIQRARYINIVQADVLDPKHQVHNHSHGREKAQG